MRRLPREERGEGGDEVMTHARIRPAEADPRIIEIDDAARVLGREQRHFAVIDIGSNSMRLVVYDNLSRAPFARFNEKSFVALGRGLDGDGRFTGEAIDRALR